MSKAPDPSTLSLVFKEGVEVRNEGDELVLWWKVKTDEHLFLFRYYPERCDDDLRAAHAKFFDLMKTVARTFGYVMVDMAEFEGVLAAHAQQEHDGYCETQADVVDHATGRRATLTICRRRRHQNPSIEETANQ